MRTPRLLAAGATALTLAGAAALTRGASQGRPPAPAHPPRLGQAATPELMAAGRPRHQQLTLPQMGEVA